MANSGHGGRYRVGLLIAAAAIIGVGVAIKPKEKTVTPLTEIESARLRRLAQERRLQELGEYISYAAQTAAKGLVYLPELGQTAVAIDGHTAATGLQRVVHPVTKATSAERPIPMKLLARRPDVPVLLMRPADGGAVFAPPRADVDTGDWVIAVALREDATPVFAYGLYEHPTEARCGSHTYTRLRASIPLTGAFVGGGLFSLRGALAGVVARCGPDIVVLSVASIASALTRPVPPNDWLEDRFGLRVVQNGDASLEAIAVWSGGAADKAGIRPGDTIAQIDGADVGTADAAVAALQAEGEHTVALRRGGRTVRATLVPVGEPEEIDITGSGLAIVDTPGGVVVRSVQKDGAAARAGLIAGDIVSRYGRSAATSASEVASAIEKSSDPVILTLDRGGSVFEARLSR